jgi:chromosome segregation ATPase
MKKTVILLTCLALSIPAVSVVQAQKYKSQKEREEYYNKRVKEIDQETERATDRIRDGQKGLSNSGATHNRIQEREREGEERKRALKEHLNRPPGGPYKK